MFCTIWGIQLERGTYAHGPSPVGLGDSHPDPCCVFTLQTYNKPGWISSTNHSACFSLRVFNHFSLCLKYRLLHFWPMFPILYTSNGGDCLVVRWCYLRQAKEPMDFSLVYFGNAVFQ